MLSAINQPLDKGINYKQIYVTSILWVLSAGC